MTGIKANRVKIALWAALALVVASAGGCGMSKPYPEKSLYAISVSQPAEKDPAPSKHIVRINSVRMSRPYEGAAFVYKTGESKFTTDYYSGFITPPGSMLTGELYSWMSNSGLFASVVSTSNAADYDMALATEVTSLYGDYSQGKTGQATIEARFFLIDATGGGARIVFQKTYREVEPLSAETPDALVKGWNVAYQRMLTSLSADLRGSLAASAASASR